MSLPRQILPGSTYLVTRRCSERRFFLRPDAFVGLVFGYLLGVAAKRFDVEPHCAIVMGNHYHAVVTDWEGKLPRYLAWLHRLLAVVLNVYRGRWEAFWSSSKTSVVRLESPDDVLAKMTYVVGNAVAAGLVARASDWPGFATHPNEIAGARGVVFHRPDRYFHPKGGLPASIPLRFSKPPGFEGMTDEEFAGLLGEKLAELERRVGEVQESEDARATRRERVCSVGWSDAPATPAPRRVRDPHIAARDPEVRLHALLRLGTFRAEYREASRRLRRGKRAPVFPAGTYMLRMTMGVRCHDPPPGSCWTRRP